MRDKLSGYSLNTEHGHGGPKARGFARILGITLDSIDYLEAQICASVMRAPISKVRANPPHGVNCVVEFPLGGVGRHVGRATIVRTVWELAGPDTPPRLLTAFPRPRGESWQSLDG